MSETSPGLETLREATHRLGLDLGALIALVGEWVDPAVHERNVSGANPWGAVYPNVRRARMGSGEKPGTIVDGIRLDRNNYAGAAIRDALGGPRSRWAGYQACHVWPETCYDPRYHTALPNLVLIPAPVVSLTDHDPGVMAALQYRTFELYGWIPADVPPPVRPKGYPLEWRPVAPAAAPSQRPTAAPRTPGHTSTVRAGTQRDVMRRLWLRHGANEAAVVAAWVQAESTGEVERRSNDRGMDAEEYATRLIYNGKKTGWL